MMSKWRQRLDSVFSHKHLEILAKLLVQCWGIAYLIRAFASGSLQTPFGFVVRFYYTNDHNIMFISMVTTFSSLTQVLSILRKVI